LSLFSARFYQNVGAVVHEFVTFRNALPDYFKSVVTCAYYTGWRKQEILSPTWNQVDLSTRTVRLDPRNTKDGAGRLGSMKEPR
jgi:integrase